MSLPYLLFFLMVCSFCRAQQSTDDAGNVQFQQVVMLDSSLSAKALINRAKTWSVKSYNSANTVIQQFEPEGGTLILKAQSPISVPVYYRLMGKTQSATSVIDLKYTLSIETKTGRYRATLSQLVKHADATPSSPAVNVPVTTDTMSYEALYAQMRSIPLMSEKQRQAQARLTLQTQRQILEAIVTHCQTLLNNLHQSMIKNEKDW